MMKTPYLIAEIGINHNGDIGIAKKLIDNAASAKFNAVKFQKRDINLVYSKETLDSFRESPWGNTTRDQKRGIEFEKKEYDEIDLYCKKKKLDLLEQRKHYYKDGHHQKNIMKLFFFFQTIVNLHI